MPEITAKMVNELRAKTGLAMMECKKALVEAGGDVDKAIDNLRKKGVKTSITERQASEGRLAAASSSDRKTSAIVVVNCNTDFTAKSDPVARILKLATEKLVKNPSGNIADDGEVKSEVTSVAQQTGENVQIGRAAVMSNPGGSVGTYVYANNSKLGVLMSVIGNANDDLFRNLGGHIAFAKPLGMTRAEVPADVVAKEREIAVEQAKATGKPQQIAEKIAEGKLNSFFAERVLLDQEFFNPSAFKGTVGDMLKKAGVELKKYELVEVGK